MPLDLQGSMVTCNRQNRFHMQSSVAKLNGIDLAYRIEGQGPPLVLIHGLACGRRMWLHQVRALRDAFTVITYDQRGHGRSSAPASHQDYSGAHLTQDLLALLDHLGIDRCHVVGFSLGGGPAIGAAISRPDRVSGLVLAGVGSGAGDVTLIPSLVRRWVGLAGRDGVEALADEMLRSEFFKTYAGRSARARCHMRALITATPLHGLVFTLTEVLGKRRSVFRMDATLKRIPVPTLVLRGERDNVCRASSKVLASSIPGASYVSVSGAGHMIPLEAPRQFNSILCSFLTQVPAKRSTEP
jgi:pimeloyl-ACP methyl ester carboxylesterase